ncbi:MAG: hypothetical protein AABZ31_00735 [Bdellovibrionota bacterium]
MLQDHKFIKQFEPSEKRLIISWKQPRPDLRQGHFPKLLVTAAKAHILSHIKNEKYDLYLLSESTLIISDHGFMLLTCGQTQLIQAVRFVHQKLGHITKFVSFSRQRELHPGLQTTTFAADIIDLKGLCDGSNLIVNSDFYKFDYFLSRIRDADFFATQSRRVAILCHPLEEASLAKTQLAIGSDLLKAGGWSVDEHLFQPWGYSLNAAKDDKYMTLHMSLSGVHMYVTGETNADFSSLEAHWRKSLPRIAARIEFNHNAMGQPMLRQQSVGLAAA